MNLTKKENKMGIARILKQIKQEAKEKALNNGAYTGYQLVSKLKDISDRTKPVYISMKIPIYNEAYDMIDFNYELVCSDFKCDSWRGSYDLPSASYVDSYCSVESYYSVEYIINSIEDSDGKEVEGYKGGDFVLSMNNVIYIANYGDSNYSIAVIGIEELSDRVILHTEPDMY